MKKFILILTLFSIAYESNAVLIIINKTYLSHNPKDVVNPDYRYTKRNEEPIKDPFDPSKIVQRNINITCEGNGLLVCPNSIKAPEDISGDIIGVAETNFFQNLLNINVASYENDGIKNNENGTLLGQDGVLYYYNLIWVEDPITNQVSLTFTIND